MTNLHTIWKSLYGEQQNESLDNFIIEIEKIKKDISFAEQKQEWYKDAIVYSLYVDLFNTDFAGLADKLDYLAP